MPEEPVNLSQSGEVSMGSVRPYPSYLMYRDKKGEWRWRYDSAPFGDPIAVSSGSFKRRTDCRNSIRLLMVSASSEVWLAKTDTDAS